MMDQRDFAAAQDHIANTVAATQVAFAAAPNPELQREIEDLQQVSSALGNRGADSMSRKVMAYYSQGTKRGR